MTQLSSYPQILRRNYLEITSSYGSFNAYYKMWTNKPSIYPGEFLGQCSMSLFNTTISHLIKTLEIDNTGKSKTFWTIYKMKKNRIDELLKDYNVKISFIKKMAKKLALIRNKTLFHLDEKGIINSKDIWISANLTIDNLHDTIDLLHKICDTLYNEDVSILQPFVFYDGSDAAEVVSKIKNI